jgi:hypothetical protein
MKAFVVGPGADVAAVVDLFARTGSVGVETCRSAARALHRLNETDASFDWLMLSNEIPAEQRDEIARRATSLNGKQCVVSVFGGAGSANDEFDTDDPLGTDDLQRWRNVLNFAVKAPEDFPAIRDAMVARPSVLQFHAPCKRTA